MRGNNFQPRGARKGISLVLIAVLLMPFLFITGQQADAAVSGKVQQVYDQQIARGINYSENNYSDYQGIAGRRENEHIITADLNDPTVQVVTGKANDKVLKIATLSQQITGEQAKGQNVVAGINGDMFNISLGTMHYGSPLGLQVKDGKILVGFETNGSGPRYPVFAIDKNRQAMVTYVSMDNQLSVVDEAYEKANGKANPDLTMAIDTINRNNTVVMNDQMILATPQLAQNPTMGFTEAQAANGTLTVLKNIQGSNDGSVKLGQVYEAEVVSLGDTSTGVRSAAIPADGMVLASQGIKATWVKEHLKAGDKVRFSFNIKDQAGKTLDLEQAVTAWLPLVENGQALSKAAMLNLCKDDWDHGTATIGAGDKARTAIGFTRDNKVVALVFDGGGATKDSYGIDLPGMAMRMQELGVVAAVSLDGGGSTQMNTRRFGESVVQVINQPSDNFERPVSNTILFASNAPRTYDVGELQVKQDITIYKNTSYNFQVKGQDSNGNPADLSNADIAWSLKPADGASGNTSGTIDNKGSFRAGDFAARQRVQASIASSVTADAQVNVVDRVASLGLTDNGVLALEPGVPKQLQIMAYTPDGTPIVITNDAAEWSVTPTSSATINQQGLLNVWGKCDGVAKAKVGDQEVSISFVSGQDAQFIDSFETYDSSDYYVNGYIGGSCQVSSDVAKDWQHSLRVDYDYASWGKVYNGTINISLDADKRGANYITNQRPKKFGMWVYGDGQAPWLRAMIKDGNGNAQTLNLASRINWVGWQYVSVAIPENIPLPISLDYFYMVETDKSKTLKGTVYFDDLRFIYSDQGATVSSPNPVPVQAPASKASPSASEILVDGVATSFNAYLINDNNYFKLRDLAKVVSGTGKQFEVQWNNATNTIHLFSGQPYIAIGGELAPGDGVKKIPVANAAKIYKDGTEIVLTAYNIDGYNYFKLRDVAQAFNIGVSYDGQTNTVGIDTSIGYVAP